MARRSAAAVAGNVGSAEVELEARVEVAAGMAGDGVARVGYAPIVRVDAPRREVELCATSEAVDSYGTVFDYAASKEAFTRWLGNVREMHDRRAVGRRVAVRCDDEARRIFVRVRISAGARDTWEKIADGTLRGASIGASDVVWERQTRRIGGQERTLNVATRYELVELSLVDNPSNPDALGITIVRAATPDPALLDALDADGAMAEDAADYGYTPCAPTVAGGEGRDAGAVARVSAPPRVGDVGTSAQTGMSALPQTGMVARAEEEMVGRIEEERALGPFSANAEGQPDMGVPARAEERPTSALEKGARHAPLLMPDGNARERFHAAARSILLGCGCPLCAGAIAALGEDGEDGGERSQEMRDGGAAAVTGLREAALARALAAGLGASVAQMAQMDASVRALDGRVAGALDALTGTLGDLRMRVEQIEAQPMPGGPVARPVPVEKVAALSAGYAAAGGEVSAAEQFRALESLAGRLSDPQAQIAVAAELIRLRQAGR
ncbi:MAG: hypothetical protein OJF49_002747 [Ktedonobacterales bacterium]|jgi:hypothetical protein|nr:MAG: hypothetical protein OJF49_002747 [Ktedonobacterales bacterium]